MNLKIQFDSKNSTFTAGEVVSGQVILENSVPIEANRIAMSIMVVFGLHPSQKMIENSTTETKPHVIEKLSFPLVEENKKKTKFYPIGSHTIKFSFSKLSLDCIPSWDTATSYVDYLMKAKLDIKSKASLTTTESFQVCAYPLNKNKNAQKWQTKMDSRFKGLSLKKASATVTVPTGVGYGESTPIHISISNEPNNFPAIIRSKLIRMHRNPNGLNVFGPKTESIFGENIEKVNEFSENQFVHLLKNTVPDNFASFNSPLMSLFYYLQVEVETFSSILLDFEFSVIVGGWQGNPIRPELYKNLMANNITPIIPVPPALSMTPTVTKNKKLALSLEKEREEMEIKLDRNNYLAGDIVSGSVCFKNLAPANVTRLNMCIILELGQTAKVNTTYLDHNVISYTCMLEKTTIEINTYPLGTKSFPFLFPTLSTRCVPSWETKLNFVRYYVKASCDRDATGSFSVMKKLKVGAYPLEMNNSAVGWKTKSKTYFPELSSHGNPITTTITVPTGVGLDETVPIHILINQLPKDSFLTIQSKLIRKTSENLTFNFADLKNESIRGECIEILNTSPDHQITHFLKITEDIPSFCSPLFFLNHAIQVVVETSTLNSSRTNRVELEFEVVVGSWSGEPMRQEPTIILPSAPPAEEDAGHTPPPPYEEACQVVPLLYPSLPLQDDFPSIL